MIEYASFQTPSNAGKTEEVLKLLGETFGKEEEMMERRQLSGAESRCHDDYLFTAWENGKLLGTIHLTENKKNPAFGLLGGLVTVPEARGRGVAKTLFGSACAQFDRSGGKALFLGTENPVAARIYERFGFSFISGTNIMARVKDGSLLDFYNDIYAEKEYEITEMDDGCRIPVIPAAAARGRDLLMDANADILNNFYATQVSCAGLYPRFLKIKESGRVLAAKLPNQGVCAVLTEKERGGVSNVDGFAFPGFEAALEEMLSRALNEQKSYSAVIAKEDREKAALFESFGFAAKGEYDYAFNRVHVPCTYYLLEK